VQFLQRHYQIVSLSDAIEMLKTNSVKRPTVVLTFDDGYRDNFIGVRAIVEQTGVPISMFVSTDHVTQQNEFKHDAELGVEGFLPLRWEEVRQMQKEGFEIGSHTRTHFDCGSRNAAALENEIVGSKEELERRLGHRIEFFSFPFGLPLNISREAAELAAETYPYLLSAFGGDNMAGTEPQHLRRRCHPQRLWDLELQIQGVLETEPDSPDWLEKRDCTQKGITIVDSIDESAAS
jgi:peptidoglycan/xylan/chitin deacetylase (PgdA/CDA1 family)